MEWPRTRRFDRLAAAAEALTKQNTRWQRAILLDPKQYHRVQGAQTGQPVLRVGIDEQFPAAVGNLFRTALARAALRALPYVDSDHRDRITLNKWTELAQLEGVRWGGPYRDYRPDEQLAAPVDGVLWKSIVEDPVAGRDAWGLLKHYLSHLRAAKKEPLSELFVLALHLNPPLPPSDWTTADLQPVAALGHEVIAGLWRQILGGGPAATLLAEALSHTVAPDAGLPEPVMARIEPELRSWRDRATPPSRAIEPWTELLADIDGEVLEEAWLAGLRDAAGAALLQSLLDADRAIAPADELLWRQDRSFGATHPLVQALEKLAPTTSDALLKRHKDESGRFKAKARRQAGAAFLAKCSVLFAYDRWAAELIEQMRDRIELGPSDPGQIATEEGRGALYGFVPGDLRDTVEAPVAAFHTGHLFADLAGFTALTARLKEVEVRQFLRQNFYGPLLGIAKDYYKGGHGLSDEGGIRLNNLLGDAVSLSGDAADLIEFAERATKLVQDELSAELRENVRTLSAADAEARREPLTIEARELRVKRARGEGDAAALDVRLMAIQDELEELEAETDGGVELDFGVYLAHGAAPIDLSFEDDLFGQIHVALAEKINESARGVARDSGVEAALAQFSQRFPDRPLAFRIHVGPKITGAWPEELADTWPTDPDEVATLAQSLPQSIKFRGGTAMYNTGIGMSERALRVLLSDHIAGDVTVWRGKTVELIKRLQVRYLIPEPTQTLVLVPWHDGPRIARLCGRVEMKGFREPPAVWEWVGPWMGVFSSLVTAVEALGTSAPWREALPQS